MSSEKQRKDHPQQTELRRLRILLTILKNNLEYSDRNAVEALRLEPTSLKGKLRIEHSFEIENLIAEAIKLVDNKIISLNANEVKEKKDK